MRDLELVSASDIAERLGVARSVVSNWQKRLPDFPTPYATVSSGTIRLWLWPDVVSWHTLREQERTESLAQRKERLEKALQKVNAELSGGMNNAR